MQSKSSFARFVNILSTFFLAIYYFFSRRKRSSSPPLPTSSQPLDFATWQKDKQVFLRRPSLKSAARDPPTTEATRQLSPPPPVICVQDWSCVQINMAELLAPPPSRLQVILTSANEHASKSNACKPITSPCISEKQQASINSTIESPKDVLTPGPVVVSAFSAISGPLFDFPTCTDSVSTPLPSTEIMPLKSPSSSSPSSAGARESLLPYPELFDFDMYGRRVSQESFQQPIQLPALAFADDESMELHSITVTFDNIHKHDSPCDPSPLPQRIPLMSTLNVETVKSMTPQVEEKIWWKGEMGLVDYDKLPRW